MLFVDYNREKYFSSKGLYTEFFKTILVTLKFFQNEFKCNYLNTVFLEFFEWM